MQDNKVKSFTLSELLVVMIITVIVVGIAFSVLSLVQRQIHSIRNNFDKTSTLSLFEQRLWQDFNSHNNIYYATDRLLLLSDVDTVDYRFKSNYTLRNSDTIPLNIVVKKTYFTGNEIKSGPIDAVSLSAKGELPHYLIFVSKENDASNFMNRDGF